MPRPLSSTTPAYLPEQPAAPTVPPAGHGLAGRQPVAAARRPCTQWRPRPFSTARPSARGNRWPSAAKARSLIVNGAIRLERGNDLTGVVWTGKVPGPSFRVQMEAMRLDGSDFFCAVTVPVAGTIAPSSSAGGAARWWDSRAWTVSMPRRTRPATACPWPTAAGTRSPWTSHLSTSRASIDDAVVAEAEAGRPRGGRADRDVALPATGHRELAYDERHPRHHPRGARMTHQPRRSCSRCAHDSWADLSCCGPVLLCSIRPACASRAAGRRRSSTAMKALDPALTGAPRRRGRSARCHVARERRASSSSLAPARSGSRGRGPARRTGREQVPVRGEADAVARRQNGAVVEAMMPKIVPSGEAVARRPAPGRRAAVPRRAP